MRERDRDQADGLRELFRPRPPRRPICFVAVEPALVHAGMLSLAAGLEAFGRSACIDRPTRADAGDELHLFPGPQGLAARELPAGGIDLIVQGNAGPRGLTGVYGQIKAVHAVCKVVRLGVIVAGSAEPEIARRCRDNLERALEHFLDTRLAHWGCLGVGEALQRAAIARTSVQQLDPGGNESREFARLAGALAGVCPEPGLLRVQH